MLGHLGLDVTRLIRVSFGPFQLAELAEGAVEEVRTRVLREQLGTKLIGLSRADFSAPTIARDAPKRDAPAAKTPQKPVHHAWRAHEEQRPGKKLQRKYHGARRGGKQPAVPGAADKRSDAVTDRKGRFIAVERFGQAPVREAAAQGNRQARPLRPAACVRRSLVRTAAARAALMRVIGGSLRGRTLAAPKSQSIRPTADRLREALFNILVHAYDDPIGGARVLDLFAGTGALGIEALSRGAAFTLFIDDGAEARALLRENTASLGLGGTSRIFRRDATKLGPAHPVEPFSLAFLDPPYGQQLAEKSLASARAGAWFAARRTNRGGGSGKVRLRGP